MGHGENSNVPHLVQDQRARDQALNGLKQGRIRVLVATDVAARGLDIKGIGHSVVKMLIKQSGTPAKTNMTMENPPLEDVFSLEHGIFQCHVSFQGCK